MKISPEAHPESAAFSPDGLSLVLGSVDGFVEIWDPDSCKLRTDLEYVLMLIELIELCWGCLSISLCLCAMVTISLSSGALKSQCWPSSIVSYNNTSIILTY